jgi:hypothetical protein
MATLLLKYIFPLRFFFFFSALLSSKVFTLHLVISSGVVQETCMIHWILFVVRASLHSAVDGIVKY